MYAMINLFYQRQPGADNQQHALLHSSSLRLSTRTRRIEKPDCYQSDRIFVPVSIYIYIPNLSTLLYTDRVFQSRSSGRPSKGTETSERDVLSPFETPYRKSREAGLRRAEVQCLLAEAPNRGSSGSAGRFLLSGRRDWAMMRRVLSPTGNNIQVDVCLVRVSNDII